MKMVVFEGLTEFDGASVWTDGIDTYFSSYTSHYVLDVENKKWIKKQWKSLDNFNGKNIWTDGTKIYYSNGNSQYLMNAEIN